MVDDHLTERDAMIVQVDLTGNDSNSPRHGPRPHEGTGPNPVLQCEEPNIPMAMQLIGEATQILILAILHRPILHVLCRIMC